jgi:hypothetical protein
LKRALTRVLPTLVLLAACSVDLDVVLFNFSGSPIEVLIDGTPVEVAPSSSTEFKLGVLYGAKLGIRSRETSYRYEIDSAHQIPPQFWRSGGWVSDIWLRVDPDLSISLVSTSTPRSDAEDQPEGFPLKPVQTEDVPMSPRPNKALQQTRH